ncbi:MAG TPA: hypothetical protein VGY56_06485 [Verrucomicrobiae bacterium]|nr:hypothetical protein [Verrucomicrobiae bacterium]
MLLRLGKLVVVCALVATLSAHWALLQTVAWTSMLAGNLQSCSFHDAVARTFDGRHPCPLCKAIAAGQKSEQKNQINFGQQKLEFPPVEKRLVLIAPSPVEISSPDTFAAATSQKPPTPPPRGLFA